MAGSHLMDPPMDRLVGTLNPAVTLLHDDWYTTPRGGVGGDSEEGTLPCCGRIHVCKLR